MVYNFLSLECMYRLFYHFLEVVALSPLNLLDSIRAIYNSFCRTGRAYFFMNNSSMSKEVK